MADVSSTSPSSTSSCDEESLEMEKIREAIDPQFCNLFPHTSSTPRSVSCPLRTSMSSVTDMEICRNGVESPGASQTKPPSVRDQWSSSREAPEVNVLKVTKGFQNHVAMRLGTIIDSSIKEVNKNLSTIHLSENSPRQVSPLEGGIRIFSHSEVWNRGAESDESERTNVDCSKKDDSETDRTKGLTESEVQLSDIETVRKRRKRKKRRPNKDLDYQSESACELPDSGDFGLHGVEAFPNESEIRLKKRKRAKEMTCVYQKKCKRRKLDTDSGGDGDVSSDTDTDIFSQPSTAQWNEVR